MSVVDGTSVASVVPAGTWSVDASRSSVAFTVKHMMLTTLRGRFREFDGTLEIGTDTARAAGAIEAASIDTEEPVRDEHLRSSPDFFDVERHPRISFASTRIEPLGGRRLRIVGDLRMRGVTREIQLDGQLGAAGCEADGGERIELELQGRLNRKDFGLSWNQTLDTGGALLGEKVKIVLAISAVRTAAAAS
jgi:polyisoprenoid-binding protein YceI